MPEALPHIEHFRALPIIQPHACLHAVVELADDGITQNEQGHHTEGLFDGVICFCDIGKAQIPARVLLPPRFLQSSFYEHHVNRPSLVCQPTLFFRQNVLAYAVVVNKTTGDDLEEYFACVTLMGDTTIVAIPCTIFLLVRHLHRCTFPLLRQATCPPHSDNDVAQLSESIQISVVGQDLEDSAGRPSGPPFDSPTRAWPLIFCTWMEHRPLTCTGATA